MTQTTWATTADVLSLTGVTVSSTDQANAVIEMHAGRTYLVAAAKTGTIDLEWMRRAVAYQAAWQLGQADLFTRLDFEAVGKERGTPVAITPTAMTLAPLARMALGRVSWLKSRSLHVRSPFQDGLGPLNSDPTSSENDYYESWSAF